MIGFDGKNLKKIVNLDPSLLDLIVSLSRSFLSILHTEKRRALLFSPVEKGHLGPGPHDLLNVFHVVLGILKSLFKVVNFVARVNDVLPCVWKEKMSHELIEKKISGSATQIFCLAVTNFLSTATIF